MNKFKSYREESRTNYGRDVEEGRSLTSDELMLGAVLRIADATEAMAKKYIDLERNYNNLSRDYKARGETIRTLEKQNSSYRGVITRMKNKAVKP